MLMDKATGVNLKSILLNEIKGDIPSMPFMWYSGREKLLISWELSTGERDSPKSTRELSGMADIFPNLIVVMVAWPYTFGRTHSKVYLIRIKFIVRKLNLTKKNPKCTAYRHWTALKWFPVTNAIRHTTEFSGQ